MDLNDLIPDKLRPNWIIKGKFLMFKKHENIPICFIEDDVVYIFLDVRIPKQVILITKHIVNQNIEFYFMLFFIRIQWNIFVNNFAPLISSINFGIAALLALPAKIMFCVLLDFILLMVM